MICFADSLADIWKFGNKNQKQKQNLLADTLSRLHFIPQGQNRLPAYGTIIGSGPNAAGGGYYHITLYYMMISNYSGQW